MTVAAMGLQLRLFLVAVQFYTRLPVHGRLAAWVGWQPDWLSRATRYFPLVGALIGVLIALVYAVAGGFLPHGVAVLVSMGAGLLLTGAFHEDGFADFCDGFGGHVARTRTLEIMQDSRVGAYGAIGVAMLLMGRFETLVSLDPEWIASALVAGHAFSRGCAVAVMASLPYARDDAHAKARPVAVGLTAMDAGIALVLAVLPAVGLAIWTEAPGKFVSGALVAAVVTLWLRRMMRKRLGGYTGDCLGAVQQAAELAFYVGLLGGLVLAAEALGDPSI